MIDTFVRWRERLRGRKSGAIPSGGALRLHLGCGKDRWPGYINIDADASAECDLQLDFTGIGACFASGSVSEIAMIHSLSYLRLWQAQDLLSTIYRLLKPEGLLVMEFPDLAKCARKALENEACLPEYLEAVRGLYAFDMTQVENHEMYTPYAFGWSGWHAKAELERIGFRSVLLCDPRTHGPRVWRDTRVEAIK